MAHPCLNPGSEYAEYCREYCLNYGKKSCYWDSKKRCMMIKDAEDDTASDAGAVARSVIYVNTK